MLPVTLVLAWSLNVEEAHVRSLIQQLGDNRYSIRCKAQNQLEQILASNRGCLHRARVEQAVHHRDPEIARRAALALEEYFNVRPSNYPVLPWIDMLPAERQNRQGIIERVLGDARSSMGGWGHGSDWPEYRYATYLYTKDLLIKGQPRHMVQQMLDEMVAQEREYREKRGLQAVKRD